MAWGADKLPGKFQSELQSMIVGIETDTRNLLVGDAVHRPSPDKARQHLGEIARQPERLADLGDRAAGAIAGDDRRQRCAGAPIGLIDPLDDFLAPFMLEVDVDIGRFLALA